MDGSARLQIKSENENHPRGHIVKEFQQRRVESTSPSLRRISSWRGLIVGLAVAGAFLLAPIEASADDGFKIEEAKWDREKRRITVKGKKERRETVSVVNAYDPRQVVGTDNDRDDEDWRVRRENPNPVPCRILATQSDGQSAERDLKYAPSNCAPKAPTTNVPPTANAGGPYDGTVDVAVSFDGAGSSDSDGRIVSYAWNFGDGGTSSGRTPSHTYNSADTYSVTLTVTDDDGESDTAQTTATITQSGPPTACNSTIQEHCSISLYTGPEVCVECHEPEARDMHGSVHYQQGGAFPNVSNIPLDFTAAGERPAQAAGDLVATGINTYCGTHENSPRFTCAGCHVGNGRFPMDQSEFEQLDPNSIEDSIEAHKQLANIDCLMCHQEAYKRFPDWTTKTGEGFSDLTLLNMTEDSDGHLVRKDGAELVRTGFAGIPKVNESTQDFQFLPAGKDTLDPEVPMAPMDLTTLEAAQTVHATTRKSCLNCHAGAGGGDGTKRGDMSKENADPSVQIDMHMSSAGANLTCSDCHSETLPDGTGHRVRGRGLDLRPNDVADRFSCETSGCHGGWSTRIVHMATTATRTPTAGTGMPRR